MSPFQCSANRNPLLMKRGIFRNVCSSLEATFSLPFPFAFFVLIDSQTRRRDVACSILKPEVWKDIKKIKSPSKESSRRWRVIIRLVARVSDCGGQEVTQGNNKSLCYILTIPSWSGRKNKN